MDKLKGKRAIITGAGSGIGRASALRFTEEGASVYLVDVATDGVNETVRLVTEASGTAFAAAPEISDVSSEENAKAYVEDAAAKLGGVDVLFANAGVGGFRAGFFDQDVESWQKTLAINLIGPFLGIKYAAPLMIKQGIGSIICTASVAGIRANAGGVPYSASKAGVISLVQTTAYTLIGTNVRVNAVCPGLIETGMTQGVFDRARERGTEDRIGQINASRRGGQPVEIANMATFLASDEASYVNGQALAVDGGLSASHPWAYPRK